MNNTSKFQWPLPYPGIILILSSLILAGCQQIEKDIQIKKLQEETYQLKGQLMETETVVNDLLKTFDEVEANLTLIKEKEGLLAVDSKNPEKLEKKDRVLKDILVINKLMTKNREKMSDLQRQLSRSGLTIAGFQQKLSQLQAQLDKKEKDIQKLKDDLTSKDFQIANLTLSFDTLNRQMENQSMTIQQLDKTLHTHYFTEGTYRELKEREVVKKSGWMPRGGKKVDLNESVTEADFTKIDTRETTTIPINSKKAVVVSEHPEGTYEFEKGQNGLIASLEITQPDEFWKISKYLVVQVK